MEQIGKPSRPEVLEELARVSRGRVLNERQLGDDRQSSLRGARAAQADPSRADLEPSAGGSQIHRVHGGVLGWQKNGGADLMNTINCDRCISPSRRGPGISKCSK